MSEADEIRAYLNQALLTNGSAYTNLMLAIEHLDDTLGTLLMFSLGGENPIVNEQISRTELIRNSIRTEVSELNVMSAALTEYRNSL